MLKPTSNPAKKNQIFWFPCCNTREDLSIDVSIRITTVGVICIDRARVISFLGEQTDRIYFGFFSERCFEL